MCYVESFFGGERKSLWKVNEVGRGGEGYYTWLMRCIKLGG